MTILTATELATELNTTGREVRKFLRSITPKDDQPGKGARWGIEKKNLRSLKSQHAKWLKAQDEARAAREATENAPEGDAEGPTDAELEAIAQEA